MTDFDRRYADEMAERARKRATAPQSPPPRRQKADDTDPATGRTGLQDAARVVKE